MSEDRKRAAHLMGEAANLTASIDALERAAVLSLDATVRRESGLLANSLRVQRDQCVDAAAALESAHGDPVPWYTIARGELGVSEVRGGENPRIIEYFKATSYHATEDEVPWCSAFACWCMEQAGIPSTDRANARSWLDWGAPVEERHVREGDVVVFWRGSPDATTGHVGFVVSVQGGIVNCLGGNQSDSVRVSQYSRDKVLGYRRPA